MSTLARYQLFLDSMKTVLKLKKQLQEDIYKKIVEENISKSCTEKNIPADDMEKLKQFINDLKEETFYEDCMRFYPQISKYDENFVPNFTDFQKLRLYNMMLEM